MLGITMSVKRKAIPKLRQKVSSPNISISYRAR